LSVSLSFGPAERAERPQSAEENQVSSTSSSRRRLVAGLLLRFLLALGDISIAVSSYQAGIWWPHQSWRLTHQGWIFSSQLYQVFFHVSGTTRMSPERTASSAGPASVLASTYHWSVSHGSITTPERSP
jgi:hypothetical protein